MADAATTDAPAQHRDTSAAVRPAQGLWSAVLAVVAAAVLVAGIFAIYARTLPYEFQGWDDQANIPKNPWLRPLNVANLVEFWHRPYLHLWIPVTYNTWSILAHFAACPPSSDNPFGLNPAWFHGANIALHCAAALLVMLLLWQLLGSLPGAALGAAFFAWHPLQVEPVAWMTGLKDVLSSCLALGALALYVQGVKNLPTGEQQALRGRVIGLWTGATLLFALALAAKPGVTTVPLIAAVLQWGVLRRPSRWGLGVLALWLVLAAADTLWNKSLQADETITTLTHVATRPLIAADALAHYAVKLAAPVRLGVDYGRTPKFVVERHRASFTWILPAAVIAAAAWSRMRRELLVAIGIFVLGVLPVLGLVPFGFQEFSTVADRYVYLAMLGPALALAAWYRRGMPRALLAVLAVALLAWIGLSYRQAGVWNNGETLFRQALVVNPLSTLARHNLGYFLHERGQSIEPERLYLEAITLRPDFSECVKTLGNVYYDRGEFQASIVCYERVLKIRPGDVEAFSNLGNAYSRLGDFAKAAGFYELAIAKGKRYEFDPRLYFNLGIAYSQVGRHEDAAAQFRRSTELMPRQAVIPFRFDAYYRLAAELAILGRRDEAIAAVRRALAIDPSSLDAQQRLAELEAAP